MRERLRRRIDYDDLLYLRHGMNKSLEIFTWNSGFDTGITEIDIQHRKLVELLNKLADQLAYQSNSISFDEVFTELANYALLHFSTEEAVWQQYFADDDWSRSHRDAHTLFIEEIHNIKAKQATDNYEEVMERVVLFLTNWLAFHIIESDRAMANVVTAMRQGMSLAGAKHLVNKELDAAIKALVKSILEMCQNLCNKTIDLIKEINERQKIESKLRLASNAIDSTIESIVITDANPAFCASLNFEYSKVIGRKLTELKPSLAESHQAETIWSAVKRTGHWGGEIVERRFDGISEPEWLTVSMIKNNEGQVCNYVVIFSGISELIKRQQMLECIANHDPLTGLPNRRLLTDRLDQALHFAVRNNQVLAICYLDLDGFKQVNDIYGHAAGDQLLKEMAGRFRTVIRTTDTVARVGGDEFIFLLNGLDDRRYIEYALQRILDVVNTPVKLEDAQASVSASIGISSFAQDSRQAHELILFADQAMYRAKHGGKSQYCWYDPSVDHFGGQYSV